MYCLGNRPHCHDLLGTLSSSQSKVFGSLPREQLGSHQLPEAQGWALPPSGMESKVGTLFPSTTARCLHPVVRKWNAAFPPIFFYSDEKHCVSTPCHRELRGRVHADCIVGPLFDDLMAHFHRSPGVSLGQYGAGTAWRNVSP